MFDKEKPQDRIVAAAMKLAATKPWREITLAEIAAGADVPLVELRRHFACKAAILRAFVRAVDDEVLSRSGDVAKSGDSARERIFDVVMTRFDVLGPYKPALARIAGCDGPCLTVPMTPGPLLDSQRWMLAAAGINTDGPNGAVRAAGLGCAYAETFRVWLGDDDEGLAKTMARLDRKLRRGERWLRNVGDLCCALERVACRLARPFGRRRDDDGKAATSDAADTAAAPSSPPEPDPSSDGGLAPEPT